MLLFCSYFLDFIVWISWHLAKWTSPLCLDIIKIPVIGLNPTYNKITVCSAETWTFPCSNVYVHKSLKKISYQKSGSTHYPSLETSKVKNELAHYIKHHDIMMYDIRPFESLNFEVSQSAFLLRTEVEIKWLFSLIIRLGWWSEWITGQRASLHLNSIWTNVLKLKKRTNKQNSECYNLCTFFCLSINLHFRVLLLNSWLQE